MPNAMKVTGIVTTGMFVILGAVFVRAVMKRDWVSIIDLRDCLGIKQYEMDIDDLVKMGVIEEV